MGWNNHNFDFFKLELYMPTVLLITLLISEITSFDQKCNDFLCLNWYYEYT